MTCGVAGLRLAAWKQWRRSPRPWPHPNCGASSLWRRFLGKILVVDLEEGSSCRSLFQGRLRRLPGCQSCWPKSGRRRCCLPPQQSGNPPVTTQEKDQFFIKNFGRVTNLVTHCDCRKAHPRSMAKMEGDVNGGHILINIRYSLSQIG